MDAINLIAFDLDGTLLNPDKQIPESASLAIQELIRKGKIITIVTGRPLYSALPYINQLELDTYFSVSDSAIVADLKGNTLQKESIDPELLQTTIKLAHDNHCQIMWVANRNMIDNYYIERADFLNPDMREFINIEGLIYGLGYDLLRVQDHFSPEELESYMVFILGLKENTSVLTRLLDAYNDKVTVLSNITLNEMYHKRLIDTHDLIIFRPFGAGKLKGLNRILNHYGIKLENAMFFGDWYNDVEALDAVGYPVLMGNAPMDIRRDNFHVTGLNSQDSIRDALVHYSLI